MRVKGVLGDLNAWPKVCAWVISVSMDNPQVISRKEWCEMACLSRDIFGMRNIKLKDEEPAKRMKVSCSGCNMLTFGSIY